MSAQPRETGAELREPLWVYRLGQVEAIAAKNTEALERLERIVDRIVAHEEDRQQGFSNRWVLVGGVAVLLGLLLNAIGVIVAILSHA